MPSEAIRTGLPKHFNDYLDEHFVDYVIRSAILTRDVLSVRSGWFELKFGYVSPEEVRELIDKLLDHGYSFTVEVMSSGLLYVTCNQDIRRIKYLRED